MNSLRRQYFYISRFIYQHETSLSSIHCNHSANTNAWFFQSMPCNIMPVPSFWILSLFWILSAVFGDLQITHPLRPGILQPVWAELNALFCSQAVSPAQSTNSLCLRFLVRISVFLILYKWSSFWNGHVLSIHVSHIPSNRAWNMMII